MERGLILEGERDVLPAKRNLNIHLAFFSQQLDLFNYLMISNVSLILLYSSQIKSWICQTSHEYANYQKGDLHND